MAADNDAVFDMFQARVDTGLYDEMAVKLKGLRSTFLGNAIFNEHFAPSIIEWSKNQMYRGLDHNEFRCNIFGELSPASDGTAMGAAGSFRFEGSEGRFAPLTDSIKVKDRFVLRCPTHATTTLSNMFFNQIATLNDAREFDEQKEKAERKDPIVYEQWTKCSLPEPTDAPCDLLCVSMGPKYTVPSSTNNKRSQGSSPPKKRLRRQDDSTLPSPTSSPSRPGGTPVDPSSSGSTSDGSATLVVPTPSAPQVGDLYDPSSQHDYRGPGYELREAKLVQRDVRDINGNLVHPRDYYAVLKPGSLVLINATLHCYIMPPNERIKKERKFYQINAHSLRVVAVSPLEPEGPRVPTTTGSHHNMNGGENSASTQAYEDFALVTASPPVASPSPPVPGPSSSPAGLSSSSPSDGSSRTPKVLPSAAREQEDADLPLEYVDEAPANSKGKKSTTRRANTGKRSRGDNDGMDFD